MSPRGKLTNPFQNALWLVAVLVAVLNGLLGCAVVRREPTPLRTIRQRAWENTASRLDHRIAGDAKLHLCDSGRIKCLLFAVGIAMILRKRCKT
jgi:hypothetical protein